MKKKAAAKGKARPAVIQSSRKAPKRPLWLQILRIIGYAVVIAMLLMALVHYAQRYIHLIDGSHHP